MQIKVVKDEKMKKNENFQIGYKHNAWTYFKPIKEH
jgi:hypothetical protein